MGRATSAAVIALGAAVAGVLAATARVPPGGPTRAQIDQVVAEVDASLREAAASARSRAQTLAELPRMPYAVASDATTVRDLTDVELAFRPKTNETIEIAQVPRRGGAPVSLLRIPADSRVEAPLATPGVHLVVSGPTLRVVAVVRIEPSERADELYGAMAVSQLPDMGPVMPLLVPLGGGVRLETASGAVGIGRPLPEGDTIAIPLGGETGQGARVVAPGTRPAGWNAGPLAGAIAAALIGLVAGVILWRRRGPGAVSREIPTTLPTVAQFGAGSRPELPGSLRIGRYTVVRRLGSGGMADVYLARAEGEAGFERLVALKVIQDEMAASPKFVSHFLDEARLASQLNHPNVVAITDLGKADDKYVIAMEFVDGSDLERLIHSIAARQALIPVRIALGIARRICDGLHYAHTAVDARGEPLHLVHRDVKSANVFISKGGEVKVGDFGIARIAGDMRLAKTEIGEVKGTPAYMAPEHRIGQDVDRRADLYAVGAICYELLTGRVINLDLAMLAHLGREGWPHLQPPSAVRPELPPELDAVVLRAMQFAREDRQASCEEMELALAEIVDRHGLAVTDKAIAQWIRDELALMPRRPATASDGQSGGQAAG
ncbi:MAG TPA: serine/threonine-protein kinase [Kofleriaceae bacterium]|nr:serine/threonine-protein kinase [Kofleriaceae bacterium]